MLRSTAILVALLMVPAAALAAGGKIVGTVRIAKASATQAKKLKQHEVVKDNSVCGQHTPNEALILGEDRRLANVVVSVTGVPANAKPPQGAATLDQQKCRYIPHVQALAAPASLTVINSDAVFHNVNARLIGSKNNTPVFNVPTPFKGHKLKQKIKRSGVVNVRCDAGHTWMGAWIVLFDHALFAVTDEKGKFEIANVPAGTWKLEFWHEPLPGQSGTGVIRTQSITVSDTGDTTFDFDFEL